MTSSAEQIRNSNKVFTFKYKKTYLEDFDLTSVDERNVVINGSIFCPRSFLKEMGTDFLKMRPKAFSSRVNSWAERNQCRRSDPRRDGLVRSF